LACPNSIVTQGDLTLNKLVAWIETAFRAIDVSGNLNARFRREYQKTVSTLVIRQR